MTPYEQDLAWIHDVGYGGFAGGAAPELLKLLRSAGLAQGRVLDLGCGSGIWSRALVDAGYDVWGVDLSRAMVGLARERVPEGSFRVGSFLDLELPSCVAVTSLGECLNYLFDARNGKNALRRLFRRIFDALDPGGLFLFDVATPGRGKGPRQRHREEKDWSILLDVEENGRRRVLIRRITTFRRVGNGYRRAHEVHRLRLYRPSDLLAELRRAGFRARTSRGYGKFAFPPAVTGFQARKLFKGV